MKVKTHHEEKPHFVFLEGLPGTGKKDILCRLHNMGYTVETQTFLDYALQNLKEFSIKPHSQTLSLTWAADKIGKMKQYALEYQRGKQFQGNTVFIHRSPLSMEVYGIIPIKMTGMMDELKNHFSISVVYCISDPIKRQERVGERNYWAESNTKNLLMNVFKEENEITIKGLEGRYNGLMEMGVFDASLPTTSCKQATAQLLTMCDIGMVDPTRVKPEE